MRLKKTAIVGTSTCCCDIPKAKVKVKVALDEVGISQLKTALSGGNRFLSCLVL